MGKYMLADMESFAVYCSRYFVYVGAGMWKQIDSENDEAFTIQKLLDAWALTQIPQLPTVDDLKEVRFGQVDIDNAREEGFKAGYKDASGKDIVYY